MSLPTLTDVHPPFAVEDAKLKTVFANRHAKQTEALAIAERIRTNAASQGNIESNRVKALLDQELEPEILPDHAQLPKLRMEIDQLSRIIPAIDGARRREMDTASRNLCETVAPEHTALVKDLANKLSAFHTSHIKYVDFLDAVESTQASTSHLRPVSSAIIGHPRDASGAFHWFFKEMREHGHISVNDIPKEVR